MADAGAPGPGDPDAAAPGAVHWTRARFVEASLVFVTFAWGVSFVVLDEAQRHFGTFTLTALRMTVGLATAVLLLRPKFATLGRRGWLGALLGGAFLSGGYVLQTAGMADTAAGTGGFLTALYVALIPLLDALWRRKAPGAADVAALAVATVGIAMIVSPGNSFSLGRGEALVALSSLFWAAQVVTVGHVASTCDPAALSAVQLAVVAAVGWAGRAWCGEPPIAFGWKEAGWVFFLGHVTCALGFAIQAAAQRRYSATAIAVIFAMEPVFAALAGVVIDAEPFGARKIAGCALVAAAVASAIWLTDLRSRMSPGDVTLSE